MAAHTLSFSHAHAALPPWAMPYREGLDMPGGYASWRHSLKWGYELLGEAERYRTGERQSRFRERFRREVR